MAYLRCRVHPIEMHLDPTAIVSENGNVVIAYGLSTSDLLRVKSSLPNLNQLGLLMLKKLNGHYGFLIFNKMLVCIHPGFRQAISQIGLNCGYDFCLHDLTAPNDLEQLSRWITLKDKVRAEARNAAYHIRSKLIDTRIDDVLRYDAVEVLEDLAWATPAFEPLHALTLISKTDTPLKSDFWSLKETLSKHKADLRFVRGNRWILVRKRKSVTLMDIAHHIFSSNHYFEVKEDNLARALAMPASKISSHLRGYLVIDDAYIKRIYDERIGGQ